MAYSKPELRKRIVASVKAGTAGGKAGQWSARKAQIANKRYQSAGGSFSGPKTAAQSSLSKWSGEKWRTKSGKPSTVGPKATGERYCRQQPSKDLTAKSMLQLVQQSVKALRLVNSLLNNPKT
jgi:hypothetical protein